ncbi:MAG: hypothetical protein GX653_03750 [Clostridiales bacterium]|nr:hypothetical protein [Clostridiales bacterium]
MVKRLNFTYIFCNDLEKMEYFYSEILNLHLIWKDESSIAYGIDGHQLSITFAQDFTPFPSVFGKQPGWDGGNAPNISWSLACDRDDFVEIVSNADRASGVKAWNPKPQWVGYWSFPLLDPMNHTIEITCTDSRLVFDNN